jgi:hypothetical protein
MKVLIDSIEISGANRHGWIEAEIDFHDSSEVIEEFGVKEILVALDSGDFLNEIGWEEVKKYFADEIQEERDEAFEEGKRSVEE